MNAMAAVIWSVSLAILTLSPADEHAKKNGVETKGTTSPEARIEGEASLESVIGIPRQIRQIVLPGPEVEVCDMDYRKSPVMLRIDAVYPHGTDLRYDLTWSGYVEGTYDLKDFLRRKDGSATDTLPSCSVTVRSVRPNGVPEVNLSLPDPGSTISLYRTAWVAGGAIWISGLCLLLRWMRPPKTAIAFAVENPEVSRLQKIEQLLNEVLDHRQLTAVQKAALDRLVLDFWRDQKNLRDVSPEAALLTLKKDPEAGPLLQTLERWLYDRPEASAQADPVRLLEPLRNHVAAVAGRVAREEPR